MKKEILTLLTSLLILSLMSCSGKIIDLSSEYLDVRNREIVSTNSASHTLSLNNQIGDGMAIIQNVEFDEGLIELELKGENNPGRSFVGVAFNIQNDSTYEAVYFRPFNFQSDEKISREHSMQYIFHPKYSWRFLRTNHEGKYESDYPRMPSPDDWFGVQIKIDDRRVYVYDVETNSELLSVERLTPQVSDRIGLWTGFNSKGQFRNLKVKR